MPRLHKKSFQVGLPPGSLNHLKEPVQIRYFDYDKEEYREKKKVSLEEACQLRNTKSVSWINVDGRDVDVISQIDERFGVHPLVLEDIINTGQRPKLEEYDKNLFLVLKMIYSDVEKDDIYSEQVSLILGDNFVLSFQEKEGDVFESVRDRIRVGRGKIRFMKGDYLVYALSDAIVDHYFEILECIGDKIDEVENELMSGAESNIPFRIHKLKRQVIFLRKQIWPLREVLGQLLRSDSKFFLEETKIYIRDVYDHATQVNDTIEAFRDALSGLHDIYLSSVSNKMNEIMKVLTIFAAIFIPLTFVAGIYGMNFDYMPELHWKGSYFVALGVMTSVGVGMVMYFKKKGWM